MKTLKASSSKNEHIAGLQLRFLGQLAAMLAMTASGAVHYVDVNSATPTAPYSSWETAAIVIQDAIDAADPGDEVVVTNGIYATGGKDMNRVMISKSIVLRSVNGPRHTVIEGYKVPGTANGDSAIRWRVYRFGGLVD